MTRQKEFARHYTECAVGAEAARRAGYSAKSARSQAADLLKKPQVAAEVARLRAEMMPELEAATRCTVKSLLLEAEEARVMSMKIKSGSGAIAAVALKAKLTGLISDRVVDVVEREKLEAAIAERGEIRTAAALIRSAALSLNLPAHATPADIVTALADRNIPTPEAYLLLHGGAQDGEGNQ